MERGDLTKAVVRDALIELEDVGLAEPFRKLLLLAVKQIGLAKLKEFLRRIAAAYIAEVHLPFEGAIARRKALPALDAMLDDAYQALKDFGHE